MPNSGYFDTLFAASGTRTTVPDTVQLDGSISYSQGWGVNYTLQPGTPGALNVDNATTNQVLYDVTSAIQQYQQNGIPPFITTAMNNGTPYSYNAYAMVLYNGTAYQSNTNGNTDTPPSSKWNVVTLASPNQFTGGTTTGSANAQVLASTVPSSGLSLSVANQTLAFTPGFTNSGSTTLAVTSPSITATVIKKLSGGVLVNLTGGELANGVTAYVSTNPAVPCWVLQAGPALGTMAALNLGNNIENDTNGNAVAAIPNLPLTGTNKTYSASEWGDLLLRSNSGTAMGDTLPASGSVPPAGWYVYPSNTDATALLIVTAGTGTSLDGVSLGWLVLGPGQRACITSDGSNYATADRPDRIRLGANTTIYVATTGNDSTHTGLSSGSPFLTLQHAINYIANNIDLNGFNVTISVADGTYTGGAIVSGPWVGTGAVTLQGNTTTPANCIISTTNADCIDITNSGVLSVGGFKLTTTTSGIGLYCNNNAIVNITGKMDFGACASYGQIVSQNGGVVNLASNYNITANAPTHFQTREHGMIRTNLAITVTLSGTPAFTQFADAIDLSVITIQNPITFSGSATGQHYNVTTNSLIDTNAGGANYFPGNSAGSTASGGTYA